MTDYARLVISVDSRQVRNADRDMAGMSRTASGLASGVSRMIGPLLSAASAMAALSKAVSIQRQFDVLNAGLITATGSSEKAAQAFEALQDFAAKTPYSLDQAVEGFTKLVNLGLTPSEQALLSYGNTASAMGKDLNQMIEAVADAATGEFERLKEFGIKAKQEGDSVSLTFRGTTTRIGNNAREIEEYLTALGENEFAGAMERRMDTLDGAISNLGDTLDQTYRLINEAGLGDLMEDSVRGTIAALEELNAALDSGQLETFLSAIAGKFDGFGRDVDASFEIITQLIKTDTSRWDALIENNVNTMIATFRDLPENVRAFIQIMTVEVLAGFDMVKAYARAFNDGINAIFTNDTWSGVGDRLERELSIASSAREGSIISIITERDAALASFDAQINAAGELRKSYDDLRAARAAGTDDRLERFGVGASGSGSGDSAGTVASAKKLATAYASAARGLERQVELYGQSTELARLNYEIVSGSLQGIEPDQAKYLRGLAKEIDDREALNEAQRINLDILRETGQERAARDLQFELEYAEKIAEYERQGNEEALARLEALRQIREINAKPEPGTVEGVSKAPGSDFGGLNTTGFITDLDRLDEQEKELEQWRERELEKHQAFLDIKKISEEDHAERVANIYEQSRERLESIEKARQDVMLQAGASFFGDMSDLAKVYAGEQSTIYKSLYTIQKAYSTVSVLLSSADAIGKAWASAPFPANLPAVAIATAETGALQALVSAATPGFREGGYTGNMGVSDVAGVVHGKEFVFDADATARIGVQNLEAMRRGQQAPAAANGDTYYNATVNARFAPGMTNQEVRRASSAVSRDVSNQLRKMQRFS
ncbi:MAG: tape measure protein [Pseudomonadota bacterium]|nr:tape measure protein [Pseudomonadota bacterium]